MTSAFKGRGEDTDRREGYMRMDAAETSYTAPSHGKPMAAGSPQKLHVRHGTDTPSETGGGTNPANICILSSWPPPTL